MESATTSKSSAKSLIIPTTENVSRVYCEHIKPIEKLMDHDVIYPLFGLVNLEELIDKSYISLKVDDDQDNYIGILIAHTYPNITALPPWEWTRWLENLYGLEDVTSRNALWIHLLLWDPCYCTMFLRPMVHRLFQMRNFMQYFLMVLPPGITKIDFLGNLGTRVLPKDCTNSKSCQTIYLMQRQDFINTYKIRRAVEEDNDDLLPLIDHHSLRLRELYGSYYVAELLTRHKDAGRKIIVAEFQGAAVAVLCLNECVNYQVLNEEFELTPYNGLKKPHPEDPDLTLDDHASIEQYPHLYRIEDEVTEIFDPRISSETINTMFSEQEYLTRVSVTSSDDYSLVFTSASMFIFQDDEEKISESEESIDSQMIINEYRAILDKDPKLLEGDILSKIWGNSTKANGLPEVPEFFGEPNAFALEIAASHPDHDAGLQMLFESSFESFPEREYCIMSIPSTLQTNNLTNYFGRVVPRADGTFPFELYALHRNSVLCKVNLVAGKRCHEKLVKQLLSTIPNNYYILQQFETSINIKESPFMSFVLMCESQAVGLAIVSEEFEVEYLQNHYELASAFNVKLHKNGSQGILESLILSPIFTSHEKYFLREIHRLSDYSVLYYKIYNEFASGYQDQPLLNILSNMIPIMPRDQPEYDLNILKEEECAPSPVILEKKDPFALYVSIVPHTSVGRFTINDRIVVVGSSSTAFAFLESLLLLSNNPHQLVTFNNVTLMCPGGLSVAKASNRIRDSFLVKKNFLDSRHLDLINMRTYVNVVQGKLTKIDRRNQNVIVNENSYLPYDLLFLMTGEQFRKPQKELRTPFIEEPENVFIINHGLDATNAVTKVKHLLARFKDPNYVILIYGHYLEAYCTLHGLISYGIKGSHMVFIEPFPCSMTIEKRHRHNISIFNDPDVDEAVLEQIKAQNIKMYSSYYFIDWVYEPDDNMITSAKFESRHKMLELECTAFFCFNEKGIVPRIYRVLNEAGLVFDGRLVIDTECRTNDPKIYAAGTLTKYSRKYYASHMTHKFFNKVEIGHRLGHQIRNLLLPSQLRRKAALKARWNIYLERGANLVPLYEKPMMRYCRLPGGLFYLSVTKPGKKIPLETAISVENYGQVLITGNCKELDQQGFFRLHLNHFKRVETITCLAKFPIDVYNIYSLWGKHERMLNNLQLRFEMVLITDFFDYFKEPWVYAMYHSRFETLVDELNILMTSTVGNQGYSLITELIEMYKEIKWRKLTNDHEEAIEEKFKELSYAKIIEQKVLEFIQENLDHLPMYAHPIVVKAMLEGFNQSPLFTR